MKSFLSRRLVLILIVAVVVFGSLSCSDGDGESTMGSIVGFALRWNQSDHSGITVTLYDVVAADPAVTSVLNQYNVIGFALNQSCLFDHRYYTEVRTTTTDGSGRFSFGDLGDGEYNVVAEDTTYGFRYILEVSVSGSEARTDTVTLYLIEEPPTQILQTTTWESGHHYRITQDVRVAEGAQLNIERGTFIRFGSDLIGYTKLEVRGTLNAVGEPNDFIHWIRNDISEPWNQVKLESSGSEQNNIEWNVFDGGTISLMCEGSNLSLQRCLFRNSSSSGASINNVGNIQVENCLFLDNSNGSGLSCTYANAGQIMYNLFHNNNTGFDCRWSSYPTFRSNWIGNCSDGIFTQYIFVGQSGDTLVIANNEIESCYDGIRASGSTFGTFKHNEISQCSHRAINITPLYGGYSQPVINYNNLTREDSGVILALALEVNDRDVDARNNWWGTTQNIPDLIYDGNDPGNTATGIVDYTPFLTVPYPGAGIAW